MKTAVSSKGESIVASETATATATCPYCGSPVTLRRRRSMSGDVTYFWRHKSGYPGPCQGRSSPISQGRNKE